MFVGYVNFSRKRLECNISLLLIRLIKFNQLYQRSARTKHINESLCYVYTYIDFNKVNSFKFDRFECEFLWLKSEASKENEKFINDAVISRIYLPIKSECILGLNL